MDLLTETLVKARENYFGSRDFEVVFNPGYTDVIEWEIIFKGERDDIKAHIVRRQCDGVLVYSLDSCYGNKVCEDLEDLYWSLRYVEED